MKLSFSSFLPEDFVTAMRDISWSVLGDEDLLLFLVILGLPGLLIIAAVAVRIRRNYHLVRYADGAPRRPEEFHTSSDSSDGSESDDERNFMTLDEMLTATYTLAARSAAVQGIAARRAAEKKPSSSNGAEEDTPCEEEAEEEHDEENDEETIEETDEERQDVDQATPVMQN